MKQIFLYLGAIVLFVALGAVAAFGCRGAIGVYSTTGDGASVNCDLTGSDANWCYYDCTCNGSASRCDQLYAAAGLVDS